MNLIEISKFKGSLLNLYELETSKSDNKKSNKDFCSKNLNFKQKQPQNSKLSMNQVSHYLTIIIVGFYFILSTIPYGIVLSLQNNLTLKLNYSLETKNDYLNDASWRKFGIYREWVIVFRILFMSNHCFNLFLYLLFNRLFRKTMFDIIKKILYSIKGISKDGSSFL